MGWTYYITQDEKIFDVLYKEACTTFLKSCCIPKETLDEINKNKNFFKFYIETNGDEDKIKLESGQYARNNDGSYFVKSRFLQSKLFKQSLVEYYNTHNIYIKGPTEFIRNNGEKTGKWFIELVPIYNKNFENILK